ncbi:MAG: ABC transporter substrate-binding protein [Candidatus Lambdaproteobacteria bacterium]|nr:ABC transporter substrate-binding protein [Candidatus Lambdaproteobacteria bacterium]
MKRRILRAAALAALALGLAGTPALAQKYGGTLNSLLAGNPPSLSIHDEATVWTTWPVMPAYSNLVLYDSLKARESLETVVAELAESWQWSSDNRQLAFRLRQGVTFHDGKPFTSLDVKHTFDLVRGALKLKTKLSPRKLWYFNVDDIVTNGDHEVTFKLKRPQPSLMAMLATGFSPVYPAHVAPAELRTRIMGTGPFMMKEVHPDRYILLARNPRYFVPGRPYLDAVRYDVVPKREARLAALAAKQADVDVPSETSKPFMEALKGLAPDITFVPTTRTEFMNIILNTRKAPFDNPRLRLAVSLGLDRAAFAKSVYQGGLLPGGVMIPPPDGGWGLARDQLAQLPGYGDVARDKARAREIMASLGYSATNPLRIKVVTRATAYYVDAATWVVGVLKDIWIDAELQQVDTAVLYGMFARRDFLVALFSTGAGADDPDVQFYENFGCGSQRNYSDYCNLELQKRYDRQSQTFDEGARVALVHEIDKQLVTDVARVVFGFRILYNAMWPYVKNLVPHQTHFSYGRMQEVWLER